MTTPDTLRAALEKLVEAADDSDNAYYGTLSTKFVRYIARAALDAAPLEPVAWNDPRVQIVYGILCDEDVPPTEEHWEGWVARKIVAALAADTPTPQGTPSSHRQDEPESSAGAPLAHDAPTAESKEPIWRDEMPNPTPMDLVDPLFNAVWDTIKRWDVNSPQHYIGYCGANGSHVMLILNAVRAAIAAKGAQV